MTLEQALDDVAIKNNLTSVYIGRLLVGERVIWRATVHYDGHACSRINCSAENSEHSIQDALHKAIITAAKNRTPLAVMPNVLSAFEIAA